MADSTCSAGDVACWLANQVNVLSNIADSMGEVEYLLIGLAYVMGVTFAFKGIYSLKVYGEARTMMASNASIKEPLLNLVVAAVFIFFPSAYEIFMNSSFGYASPLAYSAVDSPNESINTLFGSESAVGRPLTIIIKVIGLGAFIRGWVMIARSGAQGQQPGATSKGIMHVFGGILAINFVGTLQIINNTLYGV